MITGALLRIFIGTLTAYPNRRRRQHLRQLHLTSGRIQLLTEEIALQMNLLHDVDENQLRSYCREATSAVDRLEVDLAKRKNRLVVWEELCNLQRMKLRILARPSELPDEQSSPTDVSAPDPPTIIEERQRDRAKLENQLLDKIEQLKHPDDNQA